ncbi:ATP-binding cassette sub-family A member 2 isoform X2 [Nematostella vectensis]|nr:ATP-binding cassette sub-family A member 2 isoform X2 [Nematostella vectensis]
MNSLINGTELARILYQQDQFPASPNLFPVRNGLLPLLEKEKRLSRTGTGLLEMLVLAVHSQNTSLGLLPKLQNPQKQYQQRSTTGSSCKKDELSILIFHSNNTKKDALLNSLCNLTPDQRQALVGFIVTHTKTDALARQLNITNEDLARFNTSFQRLKVDIRSMSTFVQLVQKGQHMASLLKLNMSFAEGLDNMTKSARNKAYIQGMWKNLGPVLCGSDPDEQPDRVVKHMFDYRCLTKSCQTRALRLMFYLLTHNPKILYAPNNTAADDVIKDANRTFSDIEYLQDLAHDWLNTSSQIRRALLQNETQFYLGLVSNYIRAYPDSYWELISGISEKDPTTHAPYFKNIHSLLTKKNGGVNPIIEQLDRIDAVLKIWIEQTKAFKLDIFVGFKDEESLVRYAFNTSGVRGDDSSKIVAGIVFTNIEPNKTLPVHVTYKIRMNATYFTPATDRIRDSYWRPGPQSWGQSYYDLGFVWLQDKIERAVVNLHAMREVIKPAVYLHEMPYPCYSKDRFMLVIQHMMPLCLTVSWIYTVAIVVRSIVYEKEQRLKEVMKMMGLSNVVHWVAWFITSVSVMSITVMLLTVILKYGKVLAFSDPLIIWLSLMLFAIVTIVFCFLISAFFSKAKLAAACGGIIYFLTYMPFVFVSIREGAAHATIESSEKMAISLLSTSAFGLGARYFALYEEQGEGVQWSNIGKSPIRGDDFNLLKVLYFLVFDTFLYVILVWYIEAVHPGSYGLPRPWYFPIQPTYWFGHNTNACPNLRKKNYRMMTSDEMEDSPQTPGLLAYEREPVHLPLGVTIDNLQKVYKSGTKAVDGLNLNLYEGQIMSFLGHNGAGKTTTMSILTGLFPPTAGTGYIYGHDIRFDMDKIRHNLGMCPQHNVLFDGLTVDEHLWFYARMKGMAAHAVKTEMNQLVEDIGLPNKRNCAVETLSGGMKRKLSVAMAFVAGSRTVILDEPTAGVDPYARRAIWDLLIKYKKGRTILLSTHFMEEADILGDRIAIISSGKLRCVGSPLYLKRRFGEGYNLTLVKKSISSPHGSIGSFRRSTSSNLEASRRSVNSQQGYTGASCPPGSTGARQGSIGSISTECNVGSSRISMDSPLDSLANESRVEVSSTETEADRRSGFVSPRTSGTLTDALFPGDLPTQEEKLTSFITSHISSAQLKHKTNQEFTFILPDNSIKRGAFKKLFADLEQNIDVLGIDSYGITHTLLEEVFLKVTDVSLNETDENSASEAETVPSLLSPPLPTLPTNEGLEMSDVVRNRGEDTERLLGYQPLSDSGTHQDEASNGHAAGLFEGVGSHTLTGSALQWQQFYALMLKRFHYARRNFKGVISQILLPALFICIAMTMALSLPPKPDLPPLELSPSMFYQPNYIPFGNEAKGMNILAKRLEQTLTLSSGIGATCCLRYPQYDLLNSTVKLTKSQVALMFDKSCRKAIDEVSGVYLKPNKHRFSYIYYTNSSMNVSESVTHQKAGPGCRCSANGTWYLCDQGAAGKQPKELVTITRDTLQNVTGRNMSEYLLYTTQTFRMHRYGALSFGNVVQFVPSRLDSVHIDAVRRLAIREASKSWYNNKGYHALPTYLNVMNNAILRASIPKSKGNPAAYGITAYNHPFPFNSTSAVHLSADYLRQGTDLVIAIFVIIAMSFVPASFVVFLVTERSTKAKHLQFVSGVDPVVYWLSNYLWDMCNYLIPALACITLLYLFGVPAYASETNFPAVVGLFMLYGWSITPMMYPSAFCFSEASSAYVAMIVLNLFVGVTATVTTFILQLFPDDEVLTDVNDVIKLISLGFPNYCLGRGLMDLAYNQYLSEYYRQIGEEDSIKSPFEWMIVSRNLVCMLMEGFAFFILTILIEFKFFLKRRRIPVSQLPIETEDEDVAAERDRVLRGDADDDLVKIENLTKIYYSRKRGKHLAVDRLCVGVPQGECFGLLGVNGAGKTSTFKMLTGDTAMTAGDAVLNSYRIATDIHRVHRCIGYCPQFDALIDEMTSEEHILLYARLRGVPEKEIKQVMKWAIRKMNLTQYAKTPCKTYSGGNKRKLSTAIALIGDPPIIFLDEPTTGMDPGARRFLWNLILNIVKDGRSVVLTSHSMEECEALCSRLAIMVNGRFKCLGSCQHLKNRFGEGYIITVRIQGDVPNLEPAITHFTEHFPRATLKERHHNMLQYQIPSGIMTLDQIFGNIEDYQDRLGIEDYSVSQTTLDNVFINFARQQTDETEYNEQLPASDIAGSLQGERPRSMLSEEIHFSVLEDDEEGARVFFTDRARLAFSTEEAT